VIFPARSGRPRRFVLILLAVLLTAACGPDLSKQNFPRTTVTASATPDDGPITDPAVSTAALRTVDACGLLDATTLAGLGTIEAGQQDASGLGECDNAVTDAGGKEITFDLKLGDFAIKATDQSGGTLEGLPVGVDKLDDTSCTVTAYTSQTDSSGITLQVDYQGGDPCGAGQTALQKVLQGLHGNPRQLPQPPGTLLPVDFCTLIDDTTLTNVLGRGSERSFYGLHGCSWSGGAAGGYLYYDDTGDPATDDGVTKVDLGGGVSGYQKLDTTAGKRCTISWLHRPTQDGNGEVVTFEYDNYHDDAGNDDACGKALTAAKAVLPKLPHA
jgi:hypothetical protein